MLCAKSVSDLFLRGRQPRPGASPQKEFSQGSFSDPLRYMRTLVYPLTAPSFKYLIIIVNICFLSFL